MRGIIIPLILAFMIAATGHDTHAQEAPLPGVDGLAGALLAARQAAIDNDFAAQAEYAARALELDPENPLFMIGLLQAKVALGQIDAAVPVAEALLAVGQRNQIAALVIQAHRFRSGNYAAVLAPDSPPTGPLTDALGPAWADVGEGRMSDALARFDDVIEQQDQISAFALTHKALALAQVGDFESAAAILSGDVGTPAMIGRRGVLARLLVLGQLERFDEALALADDVFGADAEPDIQALRSAFAGAQPLPFDLATNAAEGMAEAYYLIARALGNENDPVLPLVYARLAAFLNPDHGDALLLSGRHLEGLGQYLLADQAYAEIGPDHPFYLGATLGRAQALFQSGETDAAFEQLQALAGQKPDELLIHSTLGDLLRREDRFAEAADSYARAIALLEEPERRHWVLFFTHGIALERDGRFNEAEPWFRRALELNPDQPSVLNYLGYSLVEERRNLDEALDMIERAVEAEPDSGFIVDSLGWALYRLGRYDEALPVMERAIALEPTEAVIIDHLGDVYWMVGRQREARFQWRRALSFAPHPDLEVDRIRRKIEVGLDVVLEEEAAQDGG